MPKNAKQLVSEKGLPRPKSDPLSNPKPIPDRLQIGEMPGCSHNKLTRKKSPSLTPGTIRLPSSVVNLPSLQEGRNDLIRDSLFCLLGPWMEDRTLWQEVRLIRKGFMVRPLISLQSQNTMFSWARLVQSESPEGPSTCILQSRWGRSCNGRKA